MQAQPDAEVRRRLTHINYRISIQIRMAILFAAVLQVKLPGRTEVRILGDLVANPQSFGHPPGQAQGAGFTWLAEEIQKVGINTMYKTYKATLNP